MDSLLKNRGFLPIGLLCLMLMANPLESLYAQEKTHDKKLEKTKLKKRKKKKDKKAAQYQGKLDPAATPTIKGNPTKKKTSGRKYQERIGAGKTPKGTEGTRFGGRNKPKSVGKSDGTKFSGEKIRPEGQIKGNPTKKVGTSGKNYQERIGANKTPKGTKGTRFGGRNRVKTIKDSRGTNYRGEKVPVERGVKGNPTKGTGNGKKYQERLGNPGPPKGTDGTNFSGRGRPKKIPGGTQGTTYSGQSTAGSTSNAGGKTTIYGERGRNNKGGKLREIKQQEQGTRWKGNLKGIQHTEGTPGTNFRGHLKGSKKINNWDGADFEGNLKVKKLQIRDYGGDWAGDLKLKQRKKDNSASTYTIKGYKRKELGQGPGTTFRGHLRSSKKITNWDGADFAGDLKVKPHKKTKTEGTKFAGHLKVKPNAKVKTEGTRFAGHLRVKPNAKVKTEGTRFAGHLKVKPNAKVKTEGTEFAGNLKVRRNAKIKTEGTTWRGNDKVATRFFKNRYLRKKSREEQLFAGNYKVRRTKGKDLHPSATYTGRQVRRSEKGKELNRKLKLLLAKTKKNADQPKHLKQKGKRPKYDPKEREIWNE